MQFSVLFLLALSLVAAAFGQEIEEGVLVLTDANFDAVSTKRNHGDSFKDSI